MSLDAVSTGICTLLSLPSPPPLRAEYSRVKSPVATIATGFCVDCFYIYVHTLYTSEKKSAEAVTTSTNINTNMSEAKAGVTIRTRKFMRNALLGRRQFIIDVMHPNRANVPKKELAGILAKQFKVNDEKCVFTFGFKTAFGGQKSTGFGFVYDTLEDALDAEPKYRLIRAGLKSKTEGSRKQRRELKNRKKKVRGVKKGKVGTAAAGADAAGGKKGGKKAK